MRLTQRRHEHVARAVAEGEECLALIRRHALQVARRGEQRELGRGCVVPAQVQVDQQLLVEARSGGEVEPHEPVAKREKVEQRVHLRREVSG